MAPPSANSAPINHSSRMSQGSPRSRAIKPVVVKMPPPIILLTSTQEAVNQLIFIRRFNVINSAASVVFRQNKYEGCRLSFLLRITYHTPHGRGEDQAAAEYRQRQTAEKACRRVDQVSPPPNGRPPRRPVRSPSYIEPSKPMAAKSCPSTGNLTVVVGW